MRTRPEILHLDLDSFFASVEQRDKPSLRGKPVIVGGTGNRGVVATASYEARRYGIGSAMSTAEARRRCPNAAYLSGRFPAYRAASTIVMNLLRDLSPLVEQVSIDEAYVDLAPTHPTLDVDTVTALADDLRRNIHQRTGLTASVGTGTSKLIAKIGSDLHKPDGLTVVPPGAEKTTLAPLPIRRLPGIGPATEERLTRRGIKTIADLAATPEADLIELLGQAHGTGLHHAAHGLDDRQIIPERDAKSVSAEETFGSDLTDPRLLADYIRRLTDRVTTRLTKDGVSGKTITLKVRRFDFSTLTRSTTLTQPTDSAKEIASAATKLLATLDTSDGVRLLGVGVSGLTDYAQTDLLADLMEEQPDTQPNQTPHPDAASSTAPPASPLPPPVIDLGPTWAPGADVHHPDHGPGWVQGSGRGLVTIRFEGPHTPPGPIKTFKADDPNLTPTDPPTW